MRYMSKAKKTEETKTETTEAIEAAPTPSEEKKPASFVDVMFDRLTTFTVKSLEVAKKGLETGARWLDARAKRVGEVATKLAPAKPAA
jgi:hypothetical protein